jgi:23S rRNA pseudouridine2605 synthase
MRLQKILASAGIASRRAAEAWITDGRVRVNGRVMTELGSKADPFADRIELDGKRLVLGDRTYVAYHKPRGEVSTMSDPEGRPTVGEALKALGGRVYPVGRLDFATSGILLCTNDGDFAAALLHPKKKVPKTYVVKVKGIMTPEALDLWRNGINLEDGKTLPAEVLFLRNEEGKTWIEVTLHEGRNQQIRRMGDASGHPVMRLARVSFAGISSEGLAPGRFRSLTREELLALRKLYGVPKRIPGPDDMPAPKARGQRGVAPRSASKAAPRGASPRSKVGSAPSRSAESAAERPRYGGGAPGRREMREDWDTGVGRGRSGAAPGGESSAPSGRGGRSRTTGTGGGIGATSDMPRVKSRRGR